MKIYISSTYEDLKIHRETVYKQLRKLRHDVVAMEDYVASDKRPLAECLRDIAAADIYIGIFAWRYGYVPAHGNSKQRSITELEYRHAGDLRKPRLIFLLKEDAPWPVSLTDSHAGQGENGKRIRQLRKKLEQQHTVGFFAIPEQLASDVVAAVYRAEHDPDAASVGSVSGKKRRARAGADASPRRKFTNLWNPGDTLRLRFLDGDTKQKQVVKRFVPLWTAYANLAFEWTDDPQAEIRISFKLSGSWSYVGTDALAVPSNDPTVNLGWLSTTTPDLEAEFTILHEFGHVLGLMHEHQNPEANIPWDKKAVYKAYSGPPNYWERSAVETLMFIRWERSLFPYKKPFDPMSIMTFPIPNEFTKGEFEIGSNRTVSAGDKDFVKRLYPYDS
jgi:hypothetical protein